MSLLKSIQTRIRDIFNNIADDLKVQQATLMSLGALHEVSLEESDVKNPLMTLVIADVSSPVLSRFGLDLLRRPFPILERSDNEWTLPNSTRNFQEIIKAKQEVSQSKRLQALQPAEATNKNEPFVWRDNELFEEVSLNVSFPSFLLKLSRFKSYPDLKNCIRIHWNGEVYQGNNNYYRTLRKMP